MRDGILIVTAFYETNMFKSTQHLSLFDYKDSEPCSTKIIKGKRFG